MAELPKYNDILWPTLNAIKGLGGQATNEGMFARVVSDMQFSSEQLTVLHKDGPQTEIHHRVSWARTALRITGAIESVRRKVWQVTPLGHSIESKDELLRRYRDAINSARKVRLEKTTRARKERLGVLGASAAAPAKISRPGRRVRRQEASLQVSWRDTVLNHVKGLSGVQFKRLCERLLAGAGFSSLSIEEGSENDSFVGYGTLCVSLISFSTMVHAIRSDTPVGPDVIQNFRGSMAGRAHQGLIITTGQFSDAATKEAVRDGAPPIDLVDGYKLCDMLREQQLGVKVVEIGEVQEEYFAGL